VKNQALLLGASVLALGWGGLAQAAATDSNEVVVTAERRVENLQTTAIAATVVTGATLENKGVLFVDQLQFIAPAVVINNFGQGIDFNIRGIGKAEHNSQTTTGVITYRDGVPTFPGYFTEEPYYDIGSVEILRGPQGTLAGQNATGGAVFVNTNNPVIGGGYHGYVEGHVGNYTELGGEGATNIPISSTLAARVAVFAQRRDSFYHITGPGGAPYTGDPGKQGWLAGRVSLLWKPSEPLSVLLKADFDSLNNGAYPADPVLSPNDIFHITANAPQQAKDRFVRTSAKIDYALPEGITFRSISAYQGANTSYAADLDGTAAVNDYFFDAVDEHIYSEEVNIISPDKGMITWVLGGFAQWDELYFLRPQQFLIRTPPPGPGDYTLDGTNPKTNYAVFGQVSLNLPDGLQLQLGGRYSTAKTTNHVKIVQYGLPLTDEQSATYNSFSWKGALNWTINPNQFVYAFAARSYRPGGLNVPVGLGIPAPFDQERVTEFEVGWKMTALDGHLRTQVDGYYNDYRNFQVTIGYPAFPVFGFELNVPNKTEIYGVEASAEARFGALAFDGGVGWTHSSLGAFYATDPRIASFLPCNINTGPASFSCFNLQGHEQTYAPDFTFNIAASYDFRLMNGDTITPRVNYGHVSPQWATLFENAALGDRIEERNIVGAQLAWAHAGGWVGTLYATNLTNQHYVAAINTGLRLAGLPRQYGFKLLKTF
jgi:iron complex outermembrane receptor protein